MSALLAVQGLTKSFGGVRALDGCSFEVAEGSVTALIGPNGSGKTTAFNVITGYQPADAGSLAFRGRAVRRPDPCRLQRLGTGAHLPAGACVPRPDRGRERHAGPQ